MAQPITRAVEPEKLPRGLDLLFRRLAADLGPMLKARRTRRLITIPAYRGERDGAPFLGVRTSFGSVERRTLSRVAYLTVTREAPLHDDFTEILLDDLVVLRREIGIIFTLSPVGLSQGLNGGF